MELRDYIEQAAKHVGNQTELAKVLGIAITHLSNAKAHTRPLPLDACVRIADMLNIPAMRVIAANELVTEKKPEKVKFWENFRQAPVMGLALGTVSSGAAALAYNWSVADSVTKFVTLLPAKPSIYAAFEAARFVLCKVRYAITRGHEFEDRANAGHSDGAGNAFLRPLGHFS